MLFSNTVQVSFVYCRMIMFSFYGCSNIGEAGLGKYAFSRGKWEDCTPFGILDCSSPKCSHVIYLYYSKRLEQSIKSMFIFPYRNKFFSLAQNIIKCIFTYLKGASFQKAQAEFTSTYPKSTSPLPQLDSCCSIPLLSIEKYKIHSSSISKQDNYLF